MDDIKWKEVCIDHRRFLVPDNVSGTSESAARGRGGEASNSASSRNNKQSPSQGAGGREGRVGKGAGAAKAGAGTTQSGANPGANSGGGIQAQAQAQAHAKAQAQAQAQAHQAGAGTETDAGAVAAAGASGAGARAARAPGAGFVRSEATDAFDDGPVVGCAAIAQPTEEPTHFFSARLPAEFGAALLEFQDRNGFEPTTEEQRARSHVTLLMLKLDSEAEVLEAAERLKSLQAAIYDAVGTRTLMVDTTGRLESMGSASAKKAKIVAASVAPNQGLAAVQRVLVEAFGAWDRRPFHPHITVRRARGNKTIDITGMAFPAKSFRIGTIELSRRGKFSEDGYYHCEARVILP